MADLVAPIGTREIAEKRKCSMSTAWRILRRLQAKGGHRVVSQDGPRRPLRTSLKALREADPHSVQLREIERDELRAEIAQQFRSRIAAQEKANIALRETVKSLESQLKELRETVSNLFRGLQALANNGE